MHRPTTVSGQLDVSLAANRYQRSTSPPASESEVDDATLVDLHGTPAVLSMSVMRQRVTIQQWNGPPVRTKPDAIDCS